MGQFIRDHKHLRVLCKKKMFQIMMDEGFDRIASVERFVKWRKRHDLKCSASYPHQLFSRLMDQMKQNPAWETSTQQYLHCMSRVMRKVTEDALATGDVGDFLAVAEHQRRTLGLENAAPPVIFQQNTENTNVVGAIGTDELLTRIRDNFGRLAPVMQRLGSLGPEASGRPVVDVQAESEAGYRLG